MRTLESLVKAKGGWDKISKPFKYKKEKYDSIMNAGIIKYAQGSNQEELTHLLDNLYSLVKDEYYSNETLQIFPLCVVIAMVTYQLNKKFREEAKQDLTFTEKVEDLIEKMESSSSTTLKNLCLDYDNLKDGNTSFYFSYSPEDWNFWTEILNNVKFLSGGRPSDVNLKDITKYVDFIKQHPDCKEEIKDFCKI